MSDRSDGLRTGTLFPLALGDKKVSNTGFKGVEMVGVGSGMPRASRSLASVEARERKLVVSSDKIAGSDLSSEADAAAALT